MILSNTQLPPTVKQDKIKGLAQEEVNQRIERGQVNNYEARVGRTYLQIIRANIFNLFNIVLFILLLVVLLSNDYLTVLFAGFSVLSNSVIGTVQEINARRKLNQLAALASNDVEVVRGGQRIHISNKEIVLDDVVIIKPGDRLAVDGKVIFSDSMEIDESQLTGESDAIMKRVEDDVSSGSFCIAGFGLMRATRLGEDSTVNRLTSVAKIYRNTLTPTQQKIAVIVQVTLMFWVITGPMVFIASYLRGESFFDIIRSTIVYTTSLVPQGLILVSILALTIGAVKISRHKTLIQRINAVESMANVSVLCFDKTGTMTQNKLQVTSIASVGDIPLHEIEPLLWAYLGNLGYQNSTAQAIADHITRKTSSENSTFPLKTHEIPFTSERKWGAIEFETYTLLLGAPERLFHKMPHLQNRASQQFDEGLRVIAFGRSVLPPGENQEALSILIEPLAFITIRDEIRHDIQATLDDFRDQQVKFKVISGDNVQTVCAIAKEAGILVETAFTGGDLKKLSDSELDEVVQSTDVFARIEPDTKRRIIASLRRMGEYVAMVGDGVNDVPALKEANLAIAMNDGAQISKDVADIVLMNNAMSTLPLAFAEGKEITQTLYGTAKMFLSKNLYNVLLFSFSFMMGLPFPTTPIQISWAAFGTNNIPGGLIAIGFLRPKHIKSFRDDVLDYIITIALTGGVGAIILFFVSVSYTTTAFARNNMTIFFIIYGMMIIWTVTGVDVLRPRTLLDNLRATLVPPVLTIPVLTLATQFPEIFDFNWPPIELLILCLMICYLCINIVSVGLRNRGLLHRFYSLFERGR